MKPIYLPVACTLILSNGLFAQAAINRQEIVQRFNPHRTASSNSTPLQVGNGNFAFGADVTGLQTFLPYNILTTWCWHNSSLPTTPNQTEPSDFTGLDWWTHGRLVNYDQPNPAEADISQWLIANPQRVNVGRIGLWFGGSNVSETDLQGKSQTLDVYSGTMMSSFKYKGCEVTVNTFADPDSTTIAVEIQSSLLITSELGVFFDYPYMTGDNKFEAPFVGLWNATANHTTFLQSGDQEAQIQHDMDATTYYTTIHWNSTANVSGPLPDSHRYLLMPSGSKLLSFTATYHDHPNATMAPYYSPQGQGTHINTDFSTIQASSTAWWESFWETGAFVDLTCTNNESAIEIQRRIVLSEYLLAVNEAGFDPPQESGLSDNGWYGKFHAEQFVWHLGHWGRWGKWALLDRAIPGVYERFLPTSTCPFFYSMESLCQIT